MSTGALHMNAGLADQERLLEEAVVVAVVGPALPCAGVVAG